MANQWFRMYSDILNNSKVQILPEALRWRYVALLCLHCDESYENTPDDEIALLLRIDLEEWHKTKDALIKRRLLNDDGSISGWEKRQFISDLKDPTAAERQRRYRNNKKGNRNATVTSRLPESDTDTELKEKDKSFSSPEKKISGPVFIELPLNEKMKTHAVTEPDIERFRELYPAVDIPQELRNMRGWLDANPAKRKTANGIQRFITTWLARVQNSGGSKSFTPPQAQQPNGLPPGYKYFGGQA